MPGPRLGRCSTTQPADLGFPPQWLRLAHEHDHQLKPRLQKRGPLQGSAPLVCENCGSLRHTELARGRAWGCYLRRVAVLVQLAVVEFAPLDRGAHGASPVAACVPERGACACPHRCITEDGQLMARSRGRLCIPGGELMSKSWASGRQRLTFWFRPVSLAGTNRFTSFSPFCSDPRPPLLFFTCSPDSCGRVALHRFLGRVAVDSRRPSLG